MWFIDYNDKNDACIYPSSIVKISCVRLTYAVNIQYMLLIWCIASTVGKGHPSIVITGVVVFAVQCSHIPKQPH